MISTYDYSAIFKCSFIFFFILYLGQQVDNRKVWPLNIFLMDRKWRSTQKNYTKSNFWHFYSVKRRDSVFLTHPVGHSRPPLGPFVLRVLHFGSFWAKLKNRILNVKMATIKNIFEFCLPFLPFVHHFNLACPPQYTTGPPSTKAQSVSEYLIWIFEWPMNAMA